MWWVTFYCLHHKYLECFDHFDHLSSVIWLLAGSAARNGRWNGRGGNLKPPSVPVVADTAPGFGFSSLHHSYLIILTHPERHIVVPP